MIKLKGNELREFPVIGLERVRDLEAHDGPLLSHFRHARRREQYLYYWCDCDQQFNRWMVLRVSETNLIRLANGFVPLDFVIPRASQDDFVYFVDMDDEGRPARTFLVTLENVPQEYVPAPGAYLETKPVEEPVGTATFPVLIEAVLGLEELMSFPRVFAQVYSLLYGTKVLQIESFEGYPWRGGFSAVHFFHWLREQIPGEERAEVVSFHYASPGLIRFSGNAAVAVAVSKITDKFLSAPADIVGACSDLYTYIRQHRLNDITEVHSGVWKPHAPKLRAMTKAILSKLDDALAHDIASAAPRPFEAAKIALALVRRIRWLAKLHESGAIRFPRTFA